MKRKGGRGGGGAADVNKRTSLTFRKLSKTMDMGYIISKETKTALFNALVLSFLLHRCETWILTQRKEKKLTFQASG